MGRNGLNRSRDERTFGGERVDVEPGPLLVLDQEPADVDVALGGGDVQCVPPDGVHGAAEVHLLRRLWSGTGEEGKAV